MSKKSKAREILLQKFNSYPAKTETIEHLKDNCFPNSYTECFSYFNGGEAFLGEEYLVIWKAEDVLKQNIEIESSIYAPGFLFFADNGGGEGLAFSKADGSVNILPLIGMNVNDAIRVEDGFLSFIIYLNQGGGYFPP